MEHEIVMNICGVFSGAILIGVGLIAVLMAFFHREGESYGRL